MPSILPPPPHLGLDRRRRRLLPHFLSLFRALFSALSTVQRRSKAALRPACCSIVGISRDLVLLVHRRAERCTRPKAQLLVSHDPQQACAPRGAACGWLSPLRRLREKLHLSSNRFMACGDIFRRLPGRGADRQLTRSARMLRELLKTLLGTLTVRERTTSGRCSGRSMVVAVHGVVAPAPAFRRRGRESLSVSQWFEEGGSRAGCDALDAADGAAVAAASELASVVQRNTPCWSKIPFTDLEQFPASLRLQGQRRVAFWSADDDRHLALTLHASRKRPPLKSSHVPLDSFTAAHTRFALLCAAHLTTSREPLPSILVLQRSLIPFAAFLPASTQSARPPPPTKCSTPNHPPGGLGRLKRVPAHQAQREALVVRRTFVVKKVAAVRFRSNGER